MNKAGPAKRVTPPRNLFAFVGALILGPILAFIATFWTVVGFYAPLFGAPIFIVAGIPVFWVAAPRVWPHFGSYALIGIMTNVVAMPFYLWLGRILFDASISNELILWMTGVGCIFAAIYAGSIGWSYRILHPDIYEKDVFGL